jgi:lipoate-protein ligase A
LEQAEAALGRRVVRGEPAGRELALAEEFDRQFVTDEWLYQKGSPQRAERNVKIHQDVRVQEVAFKAPGGLVRATARIFNGRIGDVTLSGDFTMLPKSALGALEAAVRGAALETSAIQTRIEDVYGSLAVQSPGLSAGNLTSAIMLLAQQ